MYENVENYPKVLIIGESFNLESGGGITLSNLFGNWPKEKLAVASAKNLIYNLENQNICSNFYQLGYKENKKLWPFNYLQNKFKSGSIIKKNHNEHKKYNNTIRSFLLKWFFSYIKWFGFYHFIDRLQLSNEFEDWIFDYKPDLVYTQLSSLALILFNKTLFERFRIPLAIHIMDDWPSSIALNGFFNKLYAKSVIDDEFRKLLYIAKGHFAISKYMCDQYKERYGFEFMTFNNCIDLEFWSNKFRKKENEKFTILYAGRIGRGTSSSLLKIASAIEKLSNNGFNVLLEVQTNDVDNLFAQLIRGKAGTNFVERISYDKLPEKFSSVDLLVLPIDFDHKNLKFIKYSMPTKVPEYMASFVPVLVVAPEETALSHFYKENNLGFIINDCDINKIYKEILRIMEDNELKNIYTLNAMKYVKRYNCCNLVRENFKNALISCINN